MLFLPGRNILKSCRLRMRRVKSFDFQRGRLDENCDKHYFPQNR